MTDAVNKALASFVLGTDCGGVARLIPPHPVPLVALHGISPPTTPSAFVSH